MKEIKNICVFGSSSESIDREFLDTAYDLGFYLASWGYRVIYGAGRYGIMGAVARGVMFKNGELIGISPDFFLDRNVLVTDYGELILTKSMRERKHLMEEKADAFIICPGGIGTLEEFFEVLTLKQLGRHQKPVIILNTKGFYDPMLAMMEQSVDEKFMSSEVHKLYSVANDLSEMFMQLESYEPFQYDKYAKEG